MIGKSAIVRRTLAVAIGSALLFPATNSSQILGTGVPGVDSMAAGDASATVLGAHDQISIQPLGIEEVNGKLARVEVQGNIRLKIIRSISSGKSLCRRRKRIHRPIQYCASEGEISAGRQGSSTKDPGEAESQMFAAAVSGAFGTSVL